MKILTSEQQYLSDKATLNRQQISSLELMERASIECVNCIVDNFNSNYRFLIFCGVGNNGGDGLAISRLLSQKGFLVECFIVNFSKNRSEDFKSNLVRLQELDIPIKEINDQNPIPKILESDVVIDAIFGIGLNRKIVGFTSGLIHEINSKSKNVISIDIPSGMYAEHPIDPSSALIQPNYTLTFQSPKLTFLLPESGAYVGSLEILDIGLDQDFISELPSNYYLVSIERIQKIYKDRAKFSHKGNFGHSLIMGGSFGKIGAVSLSTLAALKSGSGLVTAYIPKCGYDILQTFIPEAMVEVDDEKHLTYFNYKSLPNVIGIGPGIGTLDKTILGFEKFLKENKLPLVIDADALNIFAKRKDLLRYIPENSVLTPHPKEFERLVGSWENDFDKLKKVTDFSINYNVILVLKGTYTMIVKQKKVYFNSTGNSALATAGSGDVLTGIITGLMAQKYSSFEAAVLGVYLHGLSADIGVEDTSREAFIARDIIKNLGKAFQKIAKKKMS